MIYVSDGAECRVRDGVLFVTLHGGEICAIDAKIPPLNIQGPGDVTVEDCTVVQD